MLIKLIGKIMNKLENYRMRYYESKINNSVINKGGRISYRCNLAYPQNISIGKNSYVNGGSIFASPNAKIIIGNDCLLSYNVHLRTDTHNYTNKDIPIAQQGHTEQDIVIEDDVWIGYGAQIMQGITIRKGSVIGAGSIVTKNTEPYGVYAGVPARKMKSRV